MYDTDTPAPAADPDTRTAVLRATLDGLADRPISDHADVFEGIHLELQAQLATIDNR
jgi:hypothetical protein